MTESAPTRRTEVRPEVQALRAAAVLLVVLFHLWPERLPGGYVGVDVFFVISGFLITAHLVREVTSTGRISLGRFWARRARRLLPAAYLVLAASALATYLWMPQILWPKNLGEIIGAGLYAENWLLAADAVDYLAADEAPSAAQHYWSLSVEEQFYLVWPLLILSATVIAKLAGRRGLGAIVAVLGAVTAVGFAYSVWLTETNSSAAHFVTPARAWEFGAGALLALWVARSASGRRSSRPGHPGWRLVSWAGLATVAATGLLYSSSTPFPGTAALVPVLGTVAVILAGTPEGPLSPAPVLRWRPVQILGDLSYSMYLWHWPPIVILPFLLGHDLRPSERVAILAATTVAAWLTKRFVEDPIRSGGRFGIRRSGVTFALTGAAAAALVGASMVGLNIAAQATEDADAVTKRLNAEMPPCFGAAAMDQANPCHNPELDGVLVPAPEAVSRDFADYPGCWADLDRSELRDCAFGDLDDDSRPLVVVIGDSHARSLLNAFVRLADEKRLAVIAHVKGSCPWSAQPVVTRDAKLEQTCTAWRENLAHWLDDNADRIDLIVTTALATHKGTVQERVEGFASAWATMTSRGIRVVAIRDNPRFPHDPNQCLVELDAIEPDSCAVSREEGLGAYDALTAAARGAPGSVALDMTDFYCGDTSCPAVIGGVNVYRDDEHFTTTFTRTLAPYLYRELVDRDLVEERPAR